MMSVLLALVATPCFLIAAEGTIQWESFAEKDGRRYLPPVRETARRVWEKLTDPKAAGDVSQSVTVDYLYLKPVAGAPPAARAAMERTLGRAFTGETNGFPPTPGELLNACKTRFFKDYESFLDDFPDTHLPYEDMKKLRVTHESARLVCVAYEEWSYTGGAHGGGSTSFFIFDKKNGRAFDPKKILRPDSDKPVTVLIKRELRKAKELQPTDPLDKAQIWEKEVKPQAAVLHPAAEGLGFHFNAYSIGPYCSVS